MSKHTKGPWKWESDPDMGVFHVYMDTAIRKRSGYESHHRLEMDFSIYPEDGEQWEEAKANVRLIAAAPSMLHMLVECERVLARLDTLRHLDPEWPILDEVRAQIAKATGEA
ncbi:hypothetical protein [Stenotrophomonas muris]|uniref:hypothetical protein n=1 Tax=Stenotrophomonas muris TaxID=2963283 RepID=UPI00383BEC47